MDHNTVIVLGGIAGALLAIGTLTVKWVIPAARAVHEVFKEFRTFLYVFNGRPRHIDEVTGREVEEVPPLPVVLTGMQSEIKQQGQRLDHVAGALEAVADQQAQLEELKAAQRATAETVAVHEAAISGILATSIERGAEAAVDAAEQRRRNRGEAIPGEVTE